MMEELLPPHPLRIVRHSGKVLQVSHVCLCCAEGAGAEFHLKIEATAAALKKSQDYALNDVYSSRTSLSNWSSYIRDMD